MLTGNVMKASTDVLLFAKAMLAFYIGLGILTLILTIRSFTRPLDATPEKLTQFKKLDPSYSGIVLGALGTAVYAVVSKQYYLLGASALLFSFVLPVILQYIRLRLALRRVLQPSAPAPNKVRKDHD